MDISELNELQKILWYLTCEKKDEKKICMYLLDIGN